ncbi:MAG: hypothetical protein KDC83_05565 [Flavobacteriales bacterium]|nr:hypothetical protein [Flavobacteriales bacterium]
MKSLRILLIAFVMCCTGLLYSQEVSYVDSAESAKLNLYVVVTQSGAEFIGKIVKNDEREIVVETAKLGRVAIPKYEIKSMKQVEEGSISKTGEYNPDEIFATRYFYTTSALPIKRGENYVKFSLFGPDMSLSVADNWNVGVITSWIGSPIILSTKYSIELDKKNGLAFGLLAGNLGLISFSVDAGFVGGVLPFMVYTHGTRRSNVSFSGGYGHLWFDGESGGSALGSVALMTPLSGKATFVFDSMISLSSGFGLAAMFTPGIRFQKKDDKAFQFGFTGIIAEGEIIPFPFPTLAWFRTF